MTLALVATKLPPVRGDKTLKKYCTCQRMIPKKDTMCQMCKEKTIANGKGKSVTV